MNFGNKAQAKGEKIYGVRYWGHRKDVFSPFGDFWRVGQVDFDEESCDL